MALTRIKSSNIADDTVVAADIADGSITDAKIQTGVSSSKLTGNLPALNGASLTNLTSANLSGALPAISGANLTGITTDTSAMENNIAILAFKTQSSNNLAKFNLVDQVIDEYKDGTGATYSTASQVGSTATDGYLATVYTSSTTTTPSTSSDWAGSTANATFGSGTVDIGASDKSLRSSAVLTGDFTLLGTPTNITGSPAWIGVFRVADVGSFTAGHENGYFTSIAEGYLYGSHSRDSKTAGFTKSPSTSLQAYSSVDDDVVKIQRVGSTIYNYLNGTLKHTQASVDTGTMYVLLGGHDGSDYINISWSTPNSVANATGTATSTANTALTAPTTGDICMLIENVSGTATLNTAGNDLRCAISRNGGTGWDYVTLVDKGSWGTNKKILTANNVAFSNSASGTDMRYKIEWANQVDGSKEIRVHATSLAWA